MRSLCSCLAILITAFAACIAIVAPSRANNINETMTSGEQHRMATATDTYHNTPAQQQPRIGDVPPADANTSNAATSPSEQPAPQLPVPKRLSAQERWNKMTREDRAALIAEWQTMDEVTRPVFLVFRDNAIEKNLRPANPMTSPMANPADNAPPLNSPLPDPQ